MSNKTVTIPIEEYLQLQENTVWLECLEQAGVDNWDGWEEAAALYRGREVDTHD